MAATTQQQLLSNILPKVNIEKITLTSDNVSSLKVVLNLIIKDIVDEDLFSTWFDEIDLKKYIIINVVQSIDPVVTDALSYSNDMVQLCDFSRSTGPEDILMKAFSYITKLNNHSELMNLLREKTQRQIFSLSTDTNGDNRIQNYSSYINNEGQKIYEIPYTVEFSLNTSEPEHLSYFVVASIDLNQICTDYNIDYDQIAPLEESGKTISEIIIENYKTVDYSYVYADNSGVIWEGPVHKNPNGIWKTGYEETASSTALNRIAISNTKVQDFRNVAEIQQTIFNFTILQKLISKLNVTKLQSNNEYSPDSESMFSQLLLSSDPFGRISFSFSVDFYKILKTNSSFSKFFYFNADRLKQECILNTRISSLKIWRRRVKNNVDIFSNASFEMQKFNENDPDQLICDSRDLSWKNFISMEQENFGIKELDIQTIENYISIRHFTGMDKTMSSITDGMYVYYVEIEIEDGIIDYIQERLNILEATKQQLVEYYNEVSKPTMKKFFLESKDPHISLSQQNATPSYSNEYGYDPLTNKFSRQLIDKLNKKYENNTINSPWVIGTSVIVDMINLFSENAMLPNSLIYGYLSPNSTNPSGISKIIEIYDYMIYEISRMTNLNPKSSINNINPSSTISSKQNKFFKITKMFKEVVDSNKTKNNGTDYFFAAGRSSDYNGDGVLSMTVDAFSERIKYENMKFFQSENPNFNTQIGNGSLNLGENSVNFSFSYISPIKLDLPGSSMLLGPANGQISKTKKNTKNIFDNAKYKTNAMSLQADMLRYKFSAISRTSPPIVDNYNSATKTFSKSAKKEEQQITSKFNDIFSSFFGISTKLVALDNNQKPERKIQTDEELNLDNTCLNNFFSTLSYQYSKNIPNKTNQRLSSLNIASLEPATSPAKELHNKDVSTLLKSQNGLIGFRRQISKEQMDKIPNQLKGLITKSNDYNSIMKKGLNYSDFKNSTLSNALSYLNFETLMEIQYLEGFEKTSTGEIMLNNPIWKTLTKNFLDSLGKGKDLLCRMKPYENLNMSIKSNKEITDISYNKYFTINTKIKQPKIRPALQNNLFVEGILNNVRRQLPGLEISTVINPDRRNILPETIEIVKIDKDKNKEKTILSNMPKPYAEEITKVTNIKLSNNIIPVSANILVKTLSLDLENKNVTNTVKNNNFIPPDNIKNTMNKNLLKNKRNKK